MGRALLRRDRREVGSRKKGRRRTQRPFSRVSATPRLSAPRPWGILSHPPAPRFGSSPCEGGSGPGFYQRGGGRNAHEETVTLTSFDKNKAPPLFLLSGSKNHLGFNHFNYLRPPTYLSRNPCLDCIILMRVIFNYCFDFALCLARRPPQVPESRQAAGLPYTMWGRWGRCGGQQVFGTTWDPVHHGIKLRFFSPLRLLLCSNHN